MNQLKYFPVAESSEYVQFNIAKDSINIYDISLSFTNISQDTISLLFSNDDLYNFDCSKIFNAIGPDYSYFNITESRRNPNAPPSFPNKIRNLTILPDSTKLFKKYPLKTLLHPQMPKLNVEYDFHIIYTPRFIKINQDTNYCIEERLKSNEIKFKLDNYDNWK